MITVYCICRAKIKIIIIYDIDSIFGSVSCRHVNDIVTVTVSVSLSVLETRLYSILITNRVYYRIKIDIPSDRFFYHL